MSVIPPENVIIVWRQDILMRHLRRMKVLHDLVCYILQYSVEDCILSTWGLYTLVTDFIQLERIAQ